ncbi:MAG: transporter [Deltaproteobacteria bacterium]|nr:transporter [Deltaproteobacteria bacterium]
MKEKGKEVIEGNMNSIWLAIRLALVMMLITVPAFGGHPLITDDTGTQGKGKFELELSGEFERDDTKGARTEVTTITGSFAAGLTDSIDLLLGVPFQHGRLVEDTDEGRESTTDEGLSDISVEVKWRFFEGDGLSFAVKPGVTFPTGDRGKGLGGGRMTYSLYVISTLEVGPACIHMNAGYIQNENKNDERKELWHASLAAEYPIMEKVTLVANVGVDRNPDTASQTNPAFILGGLVYSLNDAVDLDFGVKGGLNDVAPDYSVLAGLTLRF